MELKRLGRFLGNIILGELVLMVPSLLITINNTEYYAKIGFLKTMGLMAVLAPVLLMLCRGAKRKLAGWELFICAGTGLLTVCLLGALPFWFSGRIPSYIDALFEICSGFTTTGATILVDVKFLGIGLLFWRSISQWAGGIGVLLFFLVLLPSATTRSGHIQELIQGTEQWHRQGRWMPAFSRTAETLLIAYAGLTLLDMLFLKLAGLPMFDACCTAFSTAGTGGFTVGNTGMATYPLMAQMVTTFFMIIFGVNYALYLLGFQGRFRHFLKDEELRTYLGLLLGGTILVAAGLYRDNDTTGLFHALGDAAFQVVSIVTTTGFTRGDYTQWPSLPMALLFLLMLFGGCAGTTSGGIKIARILVLFKNIRRTMSERLQPNQVMVLRLNGKPISESTLRRIFSFLTVYALILVVSFLIISADPANHSMDTNISAVISCLNNVGPGLSEIGPQGSYANFSVISKLVMIFDMLAGRLEFYPLAAIMLQISLLRRTGSSTVNPLTRAD